MKSPRVTLFAVCLLAFGTSLGSAQNPFGGPANQQPGQAPKTNPFGGAANPAAAGGQAAGAGQPGANPFGGAGAAGGQGGQLGQAPPKTNQPAAETDLVVLAIKNSNPTTPAELLRAIDSMRKLERPRLAQEYLKKLMAGNLDDAALIDLHSQFGSGHFKELTGDEKLRPENDLLFKNLMAAAAAHARDLSRIDSVIQKLNSGDKSERLTALTDLRRVGTTAVPRMLLVLADNQRASEHRNLRLALVNLGELTVEPLIGALESKDTKFTNQVMHILGRLNASRSVMYLLRPMFLDKDPVVRHMAKDALLRIVGEAPRKSDVELFLARRVRDYLGGQSPVQPIGDRVVRLWHWDEKAGTVKSTDYSINAAAKLAASQAASALFPFDPENTRYRMSYMLATLSASKTIGGIDRPPASFEPEMQEFSKRFSVAELESVLGEAIRRKDIAAAVGAAEFLGHLGTPALLESAAGRQRPLVEAVHHADPRVQFAATEAILALDPRRGFPGSSGVIASLGKIIRNGGVRRVVVGHPVVKREQELRGEVAALGFETDMARTGRKLFSVATKNADVEFILLSEQIGFPRAVEVYQALRHCRETSGTPIAILSQPDNLLKNKELYRQDPLTVVVVEPHGVGAMSNLLNKLKALPKHGLINAETRMAQSQRALMWVGRLAENPKKYSFYNLQRLESAAVSALQVPTTSRAAANFLGLLGTPDAQQALVDLASHHNLPLELRQAAADGFRTAVKRRRVLITSAAIRAQYDRYNDTANLDRNTQLVMSSVLDSIELPTKEKNAKDP